MNYFHHIFMRSKDNSGKERFYIILLLAVLLLYYILLYYIIGSFQMLTTKGDLAIIEED